MTARVMICQSELQAKCFTLSVDTVMSLSLTWQMTGQSELRAMCFTLPNADTVMSFHADARLE